MDFDEIANELYGLVPPQFTAARNTAADQARAVGDGGLAARIKALRRPTMGAWLANLLVREHPEETDALLELGAGLRRAQAALAGPELRELTAQRRAVVSALSRQARQAAARAGLPVGEGPLQDLEEHLQTVLADQQIADAFATGRLTTTQGAGAGAPAAAPAPAAGTAAAPAAARGVTAPSSDSTPSGDSAQRARRTAEAAAEAAAEARRRVAAAERAAREAQAAADAARRDLDRATAQRQRLRIRIDDLAERLSQARDQEREAAAVERRARTTVETTDREARRARGSARDATAHLQHLTKQAA
ncbi:hypothetical protein [Streptacidiphilus sp. PAMC 29251]